MTDEWADAECRNHDPDLWFANEGSSEGRRQVLQATRICYRCPLLEKCAQYAIDNDEEWGIWGSITEAERRKLRRRTA